MYVYKYITYHREMKGNGKSDYPLFHPLSGQDSPDLTSIFDAILPMIDGFIFLASHHHFPMKYGGFL